VALNEKGRETAPRVQHPPNGGKPLLRQGIPQRLTPAKQKHQYFLKMEPRSFERGFLVLPAGKLVTVEAFLPSFKIIMYY
jgi:hypothetical protein